MKIDVKAIDAQIAKLQELKRFATLAEDPALAPYVVRASGNHKSPARMPTPTVGAVHVVGRGKLTSVVLDTCKILGQFTIKEVLDRIQAGKAFEFNGADPKKSVGHVVRVLTERGILRVVEQGHGRRAGKFAAI